MKLREALEGLDRRQQILWLALIWALLFSVLWLWWDERTLPDVRGRWAGEPCEEIRSGDGVSHVRRDLRLGVEDWNLSIDFYRDASCTEAMHGLDVIGLYDLGPKSMQVRGATTARFELGKVLLTPRSPDAVAAFEEAGCASGRWKPDEPQEVTQFGCRGLTPTRRECPVEYDIVKIQDGALYLGDRSEGLCDVERYPKRFAPHALRRME